MSESGKSACARLGGAKRTSMAPATCGKTSYGRAGIASRAPSAAPKARHSGRQ